MRALSLAGIVCGALVVSACSDSSSPTSPSARLGARVESRVDATDSRGGRPFDTTMTGTAEVPGPGDPDAEGTAHITLNPGQEQVCFQLTVANIDPATAAHIHVGAATVAGPVVVGLLPPTSGASVGCVHADRDLLLAIIQNPAGYYVNVHTASFPAGALRGQLSN